MLVSKNVAAIRELVAHHQAEKIGYIVDRFHNELSLIRDNESFDLYVVYEPHNFVPNQDRAFVVISTMKAAKEFMAAMIVRDVISYKDFCDAKFAYIAKTKKSSPDDSAKVLANATNSAYEKLIAAISAPSKAAMESATIIVSGVSPEEPSAIPQPEPKPKQQTASHRDIGYQPTAADIAAKFAVGRNAALKK